MIYQKKKGQKKNYQKGMSCISHWHIKSAKEERIKVAMWINDIFQSDNNYGNE